MWITRKKYSKILNLIESLGKSVTEAVEDFTETMEEINKENKLLREELTKKNDFIENLLSQMISGAVSSISSPRSALSSREYKPYEAPKPLSTMSAREIKDAKENGKLPLPG